MLHSNDDFSSASWRIFGDLVALIYGATSMLVVYFETWQIISFFIGENDNSLAD